MMSTSDAKAIKIAALHEALRAVRDEKLEGPCTDPTDISYDIAVEHCADAIERLILDAGGELLAKLPADFVVGQPEVMSRPLPLRCAKCGAVGVARLIPPLCGACTATMEHE